MLQFMLGPRQEFVMSQQLNQTHVHYKPFIHNNEL